MQPPILFFDAIVLADSIAPSGKRLTTLKITIPRCILAQFNTHRMFSKNVASSRAIPVSKAIASILHSPFIPDFASNQAGMQAGQSLSPVRHALAVMLWRYSLYSSAAIAYFLSKLGVHKQWSNRPLEPYSWTTVIVSSTCWSNFFKLRLDHHAQPEMQTIARLMREAIQASTPRRLAFGQWHLPYIADHERHCFSLEDQICMSTARIARVSYARHEEFFSLEKDKARHDDMTLNGHMSPLEHVAMALDSAERVGNFIGWKQYRKQVELERATLE